ncbi:hypothetical protein Tco_0234181, partial [Tanacetum coccineum]
MEWRWWFRRRLSHGSGGVAAVAVEMKEVRCDGRDGWGAEGGVGC